jgi:cysteine desulfurase
VAELSNEIYLDYHSTTPCDPRVVEAMAPYWSGEFGNPASRTHRFGWRAAEALERAREQVARLIGAAAREIVFTSGATEANNLALLGTLRARGARGAHVITSAIEHSSVLDPCAALRAQGCRVTVLPVQSDGRLDPERVARAIEPDTALISCMHANNEVGVVQPLAEIGALARERGIALHSDAAQSAGKVAVDVEALGVDLLSISAHKLCGPKGIGALYVRERRPRLPLEPLQHGGGHERGLRSGTVPVALCVGLGAACALAAQEGDGERARIAALRDRLLGHLQGALGGVEVNGSLEHRLPGNLHVSVAGVEAQALLAALPDVALSAGSACTSSRPEPSHVLRALALTPARALASIRIGLGRFTTAVEIDQAAERIAAEALRLRALSPIREAPRRARGG